MESNFDQLWDLNPSGNKEDVSGTVDDYIRFNGYTIDGIISKYKEYLFFWQAKNGEKDPKYIGKSDQLKSISDFLRDGMMRQDFPLPKTSRDYYYFGDLKDNYLRSAYDDFKAANNL